MYGRLWSEVLMSESERGMEACLPRSDSWKEVRSGAGMIHHERHRYTTLLLYLNNSLGIYKQRCITRPIEQL